MGNYLLTVTTLILLTTFTLFVDEVYGQSDQWSVESTTPLVENESNSNVNKEEGNEASKYLQFVKDHYEFNVGFRIKLNKNNVKIVAANLDSTEQNSKEVSGPVEQTSEELGKAMPELESQTEGFATTETSPMSENQIETTEPTETSGESGMTSENPNETTEASTESTMSSENPDENSETTETSMTSENAETTEATVTSQEPSEITRASKPEKPAEVLDSSQPKNEHLDQILDGVTAVGCNKSNIGLMAVFGYKAFPILAGESLDRGIGAVASAAEFEGGRVVAFGHSDFLTMLPDQGDLNKLLVNVLNWASRHDKKSKKKASVLNSKPWAEDIVKFLKTNGFENVNIIKDDLMNNRALEDGVNLLVIPCFKDVNPEAYDSLTKFVKNGGGLVTAYTYIDLNFAGNDFLKKTGMVWVDWYADQVQLGNTTSSELDVSKDVLLDTHAGWVAKDIVKAIKSNKIIENSQLTHMSETIQYSTENLKKEDIPWFKELKEAIKSMKQLTFSTESPTQPTDQDRFQVSLEFLMYNELMDPEEITAHPSAKDFPGEVDESTKEEQDKKQLVVIQLTNDNRIANYSWESGSVGYSTGLYAPAGSKVSIEIKGDVEFKFEVKIGCHSDDLRNEEKWLRFPQIVIEQSFLGNSADLASPFGGLVYIQSIRAIDSGNISVSNFTFEATGVIPTPSFFLDETAIIDWNETIRDIKAPWAEFVSDRIVLSIPREVAQSVEDPERLMIYWKNIIDQMSDLAAIPIEKNFHRIVFDIDMKGGVMHSGKPIVAPIKMANNAVNRSVISQPNDTWGFYHELGHNHQNLYGRSWTLEGGAEVTNNLFALYILNTTCKFDLEVTRDNGYLKPDYILQKTQEYIDKGTSYSKDFNSDPDLQLIYYYQLIKTFGWGSFRKVFKALALLSEFPSDETKKADTWFVMYSTAVNRNLNELFKSWGIPFSDDAVKQVEHLPGVKQRITDLLIPVEIEQTTTSAP